MFAFGYEPTDLPEGRPEGPRVQLPVSRNGEGLGARRPGPTELDVTSPLRMATTSSPERRRSSGTSRFEPHCHQDGWRGRQAEAGGFLPFRVQGHGFLKVFEHLIDGAALGDNGQFQALGNRELLAPVNDSLDGMLKRHAKPLFLRPPPASFAGGRVYRVVESRLDQVRPGREGVAQHLGMNALRPRPPGILRHNLPDPRG